MATIISCKNLMHCMNKYDIDKILCFLGDVYDPIECYGLTPAKYYAF